MPTLTNKVALVTGASRGIGSAIAKRLAAEGAAVAITYSSSPKKAEEVIAAIKAAGGKAVGIQADSTSPAEVKRSVTDTIKQLGKLDILVNNVGTFKGAPIGQVADADFEQILSINVRAMFYAVNEAVKHLPEGGRIINIGSVNSERMPFAGGSVYALTKGAVAAFTRGLAHDLGARKITVNNIQPGPVATDMNPEDGAFSETLKGFMAIKRFAKPEEIAALVSYLAGPDAGYITGTGITIDGGFAA